MPAKLVMTKGLLLGREELLQRAVSERRSLVLGRSASCDVSIPDEQVSRRHAEVQFRDGDWCVQDLQSINGTFVNDRRLAEGELARLRVGDRVRLGPNIEYTLMEAVGPALAGSTATGGAGYAGSWPSGVSPLEAAPEANRRRLAPLWIALGALALVAAIIAGVLIWRNARNSDVASSTTGAGQQPGAASEPSQPASGAQKGPVVVQEAPKDLPAPTLKPQPTAAPTVKAAAAAPANQAAQGGSGAQAAQGAGAAGAGAAGAMAVVGQLEQLPAMVAQAFPGVPPDQLPGAIVQALQSGSIQPQVAQGFIQALFPGVSPQQLPTALAGSFAGFAPPQITAILQAIYPGMQFALPNVNSRAGAVVFAALDESGQRMHIYQMNADGSGKQVLIEDASEPAFSSDGKRLAYFSSKSDSLGLRIRDMDTGASVTLTSSEGDAYPSWAPDGNRLVFWDVNDDTIVTIRADGRDRRPIARGQFPDWSPKADRIAIKGCVSNDCGIVLVNSDGSNAVRITTDGNDGQPAWSPDGRNIAFVSNRDGNWEIYAINADGSWLRRITNDPHTDGLPAWSADGLRIAFRSDRDGRWAIYTATGIGGPPFRLVDAPVVSSGRNQWTWEQLSWR